MTSDLVLMRISQMHACLKKKKKVQLFCVSKEVKVEESYLQKCNDAVFASKVQTVRQSK